MSEPIATGLRGPLIIVSGPSGSGKSTLIRRVLEISDLPLRLSVSATTRPPRQGEIDGRDYHFWTHGQFESAMALGKFLEHALVHEQYYGTLADEVTPFRARGIGVMLDIDVQGARQIWQVIPDHLSIFVRTSTLEEYEQRLKKRGTEDAAAIERRLKVAREELSHAAEYQYQILNDDLEAASGELAALVERSFVRGN
jgi:guanylate kinase